MHLMQAVEQDDVALTGLPHLVQLLGNREGSLRRLTRREGLMIWVFLWMRNMWREREKLYEKVLRTRKAVKKKKKE